MSPRITPASRTPLIASCIVHGVLVLAMIFGLPMLNTSKLHIEGPIPVDLVVDVGGGNQLAAAPAAPPKSTAPRAPKNAPPSSPTAFSAPPTPSHRPKPPAPEPEPVPVPVPTPPPAIEKPADAPPTELVEAPARKPTPPPAAQSKPEPPRPSPEPEAVANPKPEDTPQDPDFIGSLLKNLAAPANSEPAEPNDKVGEALAASGIGTGFGHGLSGSDIGAIRRHIERNWVINPGLANAGDMVIELKVSLEPDRSVRDVQIVDMNRYRNDPAFRAAADSAVRAVRKSSPLPLLPYNKYDEWREMTLRFDPRQVLQAQGA